MGSVGLKGQELGIRALGESTHRPLRSSSLLGLPYRILNIKHKKELLRGLCVVREALALLGVSDLGFRVLGFRVCSLKLRLRMKWSNYLAAAPQNGTTPQLRNPEPHIRTNNYQASNRRAKHRQNCNSGQLEAGYFAAKDAGLVAWQQVVI